MYQRTKIIMDWTAVLILYLAVLFIQPFSAKIIGNLGEETVNILINQIINIIITSVFIGLVAHLVTKKKDSSISYAWLIIFFMISLLFLMNVEFTKDRLHFSGYGILSIFLYRALRHKIGTQMLYIWSSLIIIFFALLDEALQLSGWGGRSFQLKDVVIDWASGLTGLLIIALVIRPRLENTDIKIRKCVKDFKRTQNFKNKYLRNKALH